MRWFMYVYMHMVHFFFYSIKPISTSHLWCISHSARRLRCQRTGTVLVIWWLQAGRDGAEGLRQLHTLTKFRRINFNETKFFFFFFFKSSFSGWLCKIWPDPIPHMHCDLPPPCQASTPWQRCRKPCPSPPRTTHSWQERQLVSENNAKWAVSAKACSVSLTHHSVRRQMDVAVVKLHTFIFLWN